MVTRLLELKEDMCINVTEDTQFVLTFDKQLLNGTPVSFELIFEKPGVNAEVLSAYILRDTEKLELTTSSIHKVPNTGCITNIKGVLKDSSFSKYTGKIIISAAAQQTNSFLHDDVLLVGAKAKNLSSPTLQIDANDVKASHGSTTGAINADQIYYLQSRGISGPEARDLIINGFIQELFNKVLDADIRAGLSKSVESN